MLSHIFKFFKLNFHLFNVFCVCIKTLFEYSLFSRVHALVHALLEKEHLDFVDLRRIVRFIDVEVRCGIYAGFVYALVLHLLILYFTIMFSTTCVKRGKDMVIRVDDLFCMTHRTGSLKNCLFSHANKISLWLRKV